MNKNQAQVEAQFYKVDLHIHTPCSTCYKGPKEDVEYLNIIRKAKGSSLKVIAITDHNSIAGYKKIMEIRNELERKKKACQISSDHKKNEKLVKLNRELSIFGNMLICPGVEFEVKDGIHFLVIFNPSIPISDIENFLKQGGYDEEIGYEDPLALASWDVLELYEHTRKFDCIVIDAHTDSRKGLYKTLSKGKYRASCFRSEQLRAFCFKNEKQKDVLLNIVDKAVGYRRPTPLAALKCSDAHSINEIGKTFTWVKLEEINFESFKKALTNPEEYISIEYPSIEKVLNKLIRDNNAFGIQTLSKSDEEYLSKLICALNNTSGGYCLIGLSREKNKIGLSLKGNNGKEIVKSIKSYFAKIISSFKNIEGGFHFNISPYPLQNKRIIISVRIRKGDDFISIKNDGRFYGIKNSQIDVFSMREVQKIIENRQTLLIEDKVANKLRKIENECNVIASYFQSLPIIHIFEENSLSLKLIAAKPIVKESISLNETTSAKLNKMYRAVPDGKSKGNITVFNEITPPRLRYAYLRYSLPKFFIRRKLQNNNKDSLYIVRGGAVYYSQRDYPIYSEKDLFALKIHTKKPDLYSNKFLLAFLKSSFSIWYLQMKFDGVDTLELLENIRVPKINYSMHKKLKTVRSIELLINKILKEESKFLAHMHKKDKELDFVEAHNKKIDKLAYQIDLKVYDLLGLTQEQIATIEKYLIRCGIYLPDFAKKKEQPNLAQL